MAPKSKNPNALSEALGLEIGFSSGSEKNVPSYIQTHPENHQLLRRDWLNRRHGVSGPVAGLIASLAFGSEVA